MPLLLAPLSTPEATPGVIPASANTTVNALIPHIWTTSDHKPSTLDAPALDLASITTSLSTSLSAPPPRTIPCTTFSQASSLNSICSDCMLVAKIDLKSSLTDGEDDKCNKCGGELVALVSEEWGASLLEVIAPLLAFDDDAINTSQIFIEHWPAKTCIVLEPCYTIGHRVPLKPDFPNWNKVWQSTPIKILRSDVYIQPERRFEGVRWLVALKPGQVVQNFFQGSTIKYITEDPSVKYVVTWKRGETSTHTLLEVVAYTSDCRVLEPFGIGWPAIILMVSNDQAKTPFAPELKQYWRQLRDEQQETEQKLADEA